MSTDTAVEAATTLGLPAQADIRLGAEIQAQCRAALETTGDVTVDCQAVERVDAAVLQCLAALGDGLRQGGRRLILQGRTPAFDRSVEVLGFGRLFDGSSDTEE